MLACAQTFPLPQKKSGEETIAVVNRVPVYICINYYVVVLSDS